MTSEPGTSCQDMADSQQRSVIATDNHVYVSGMQLEDQLGEVEAQAKRDLIGAFV